jgi:hypothetical protein
MNLKNLHINTFYRLLRPFSERTRNKRMKSYAALMRVKEGMSVLDLGGQPMIWSSLPQPLDLTILNLPGIADTKVPSHHRIRYVEGDACQPLEFAERSFDSVFSNSVIEHVGAAGRQAAFAATARRLGRSYWVQTPSKWFPIEAHCGMPFWWFYPAWLRRRIIERWRKKLPAWTEMVEETSVLTKKQMQNLFPEAKIVTERSLGIAKSYIAYFPGN